MKKVVVAIVILAAIITAGILENFYVTNVFESVDDRLNGAIELVANESDSALDSVRDIGEWWDKKREYLELFTYSPDLRAFSVALAEAEGSLECGDFQNARSKLRSLLVMSNNLKRILDFNLTDII